MLVTNNVSDFSANRDRPEQLHEDLLNDLRLAKVDAQVILVRSLSEFLDRYAKPGLIISG